MPYIERADRRQYQDAIDEIARLIPDDRMSRPGHLNYVFGANMRYADHNEPLGVLTAVGLELYRRKTAPYEDRRIAAEGDLTEL